MSAHVKAYLYALNALTALRLFGFSSTYKDLICIAFFHIFISINENGLLMKIGVKSASFNGKVKIELYVESEFSKRPYQYIQKSI